MTRAAVPYLFLASLLTISSQAFAASSEQSLSAQIQSIIERLEFQHSLVGMEFYSLRDKKILYQLNAQKFFSPASGAKVFAQAAAMATLGPDYRFHTKVYRTGPISNGTLKGNLILVASGDPNLSSRLQANDTLAYTNVDHSYAPLLPGTVVPGDPLLVIRDLARQVVKRGINNIDGQVFVDASLFAPSTAMSGLTISPMAINDNILDVVVEPGTVDSPAKITISPDTGFMHLVNQTKTATSGRAGVRFTNETVNPDGSRTVTLVGTVLAGAAPMLNPYRVADPVVNAVFALTTALRDLGVQTKGMIGANAPDLKAAALQYDAEHEVAEHISPPLSEESKVTLKVSENLHAAMMPSILGAVVAKDNANSQAAGLNVERDYLEKAGLDIASAAQSDGAGGGSLYTPDFTVKFLEYVARQSYFPKFQAALPVLGRDGTLFDAQVSSPASGHVFAKTGSALGIDPLSRSAILNAKSLLGYIETPSGDQIAFAIFLGPTKISGVDQLEKIGDELGEVAAVVYAVNGGKARSR